MFLKHNMVKLQSSTSDDQLIRSNFINWLTVSHKNYNFINFFLSNIFYESKYTSLFNL